MKAVIISAAAILGLTLSLSVMAKELTPEFVPGEYVVQLKDPSMLNQKVMTQNMGENGMRVINKEKGILLVKRNFLETHTYSLSALNESSYIEYAEPNYIYRASDLPNDPLLDQLWGLINRGQAVSNSGTGVRGVDIDAERAWQIATGSKNVVVAVIDTGVDYTIPDLAPNMWQNQAELNGEEGVDDDGNGFVDDIYGYDFANSDADPRDDHGHGSHCSGTIGANGNDANGVVGVNWNVSIMALKFLTASGSGTLEGAIKSIDYATENGAHIMSNSWGGGGFSKTLEDAIIRANDKGILFIAAAGNHKANNDARPTYPANYEVPNVMSVAAIDNSGKLASFSCYGKETVHLAAPGVEVLSTTPDGFKSWSGTSMATPHVSGVAALVLGNEPGLSMLEIKERLIRTARPIAGLRNKVFTGGIVNAYHALTNTQAPIDPNDPFYWAREGRSISTEHPYSDSISRKWEITVEGAKRLALHFSKFDTESGYDKVTFKDVEGNILGVMSGKKDDSFSPVVIGNTMIIEFATDKTTTRYGFDIDQIAVDAEGNESELKVKIIEL